MNYAKLRGRIREKYGTQAACAEALNMAPSTLSAKLCGEREWTRLDIESVVNQLEIPVEDIPEYFFTV